ncbi:MAG: hypothetical protein RIR10_233 [Planctomycetota bacterium]|jgi:hypothetical protein
MKTLPLLRKTQKPTVERGFPQRDAHKLRERLTPLNLADTPATNTMRRTMRFSMRLAGALACALEILIH